MSEALDARNQPPMTSAVRRLAHVPAPPPPHLSEVPPFHGSDEGEFPGWAESLPREYLACRTTGQHVYDGYGLYRKIPVGYMETGLCRCGKRRTRIYDRRMNLVDTGDNYPEGYLKPVGEEPVTRAEFRLIAVERQGDAKPLTHAERETLSELFPSIGRNWL